ncbi:hypothetical protein ODZ83_04640 [Acaricomes phytoseiuli]|uniref:hypothetical protein n=1 Tax=Acaricomes phytoseiuli TaxID=291968 RepID=UPI002222FC53|nr:hypothetical protein [Acaricomes phytoseiuli]MCW1249479.1 hypothetical protein [Acaricomes phytoseiuli]
MAKTPSQRAKKHGDRATRANTGYTPTRPATGAPLPGSDIASESGRNTGSNGSLIVIAGVIASAFMFWYYHLLTLSQMTQLSDGLVMPDSMIFGFAPEYISALRAALNAEGLGQLQYVHRTAGTLFPLIFGFTWLLLIGLNTARGVIRWLLWLPPLAFAVVQLSANVVIDGVLSAETVDPGQAQLASVLVVSSWALLILSLISGAVLLISRGLRFRRRLQREILGSAETRDKGKNSQE